MKRCAIFLDRDGVINVDSGYVNTWREFYYCPGAVEGLRRLQALNYLLIVITNQSGLARGYFSVSQFNQLSKTMRDDLHQKGVEIGAVYYCPHHPNGNIPEYSVDCACRKPGPGMIIDAVRDFDLSLDCSYFIGDKLTDMAAARAAGVRWAYLISDEGDVSGCEPLNVDGVFPDLLSLVNSIFQNATSTG